MDNKEKARELVAFIYPSTKIPDLIDMLAYEIKEKLDQLDAPEPKKWEPRGGDWNVAVNIGVHHTPSNEEYRLAGREYPTREEAERAAPLHRKLDRLVNWLVEHCPLEDWRLSTADVLATPTGKILVVFDGLEEIGNQLVQAIESGEVEL